jgi:hypothetical protein
MNIFFLDKTPELSAKMLCDKHIPKMLLESAQMLSTAVQNYTGRIEELYKPAYPNHPMTRWVGSTFSNFQWTLENAVYISDEYTKRFKKLHKSSRILNVIYDNQYYKDVPDERFTEPPQCMPDEYKDKDYVVAYRRYYIGEKKYFAKWEKGRSQPEWWVQ